MSLSKDRNSLRPDMARIVVTFPESAEGGKWDVAGPCIDADSVHADVARARAELKKQHPGATISVKKCPDAMSHSKAFDTLKP